MMRNATISARKKLGHKTVVVLPVHYPRELFTATDVHAMELWGSAARACLHVLPNRDLACKLSIMKRLCRERGATGAIFHSDRSCKPYSIGQIDLMGRLSPEEGVKGLPLEADHADPRSWPEGRAYNRLHAFMELFA